MRKAICAVIAALLVLPLCARTVLSDYENSLIQRTLDCRLNTRTCPDPDSAVAMLRSFSQGIQGELQGAGEEARLIVENMLVLETYSYIYEKNMKSPELKPMIVAQYEKIEAFRTAHSKDECSAWFYLSAGDVINSAMQFLPQGTAIKLGLREKDEYDKIIEESPRFSFALINAALWYYFAPAIGGGSTKKARDYFSAASANAACDYERFYAAIYLSQIYYEDKDTAACHEQLAAADSLLPGNRYTAFIRRLNENKYSLFYYTNNREKVEQKLGM